MYVIFRSDGEEQRYHFDAVKVTNFEAEAVERETGWTWSEFGERLQRNSVTAMHALLWILQRRVHPTLKYRDVAFDMGQIEVEPELSELYEARDAAQDDRSLSDERRAEILAQIATEIEKLGGQPEQPAPKARARNAAAPTS